MTKKQIKFVTYILDVAILAVVIKMIHTYITTNTIQSYGLFVLSIFIAALLELHTFGKTSFLGGNRKEEGDELEEHIVRVSSKIS